MAAETLVQKQRQQQRHCFVLYIHSHISCIKTTLQPKDMLVQSSSSNLEKPHFACCGCSCICFHPPFKTKPQDWHRLLNIDHIYFQELPASSNTPVLSSDTRVYYSIENGFQTLKESSAIVCATCRALHI